MSYNYTSQSLHSNLRFVDTLHLYFWASDMVPMVIFRRYGLNFALQHLCDAIAFPANSATYDNFWLQLYNNCLKHFKDNIGQIFVRLLSQSKNYQFRFPVYLFFHGLDHSFQVLRTHSLLSVLFISHWTFNIISLICSQFILIIS